MFTALEKVQEREYREAAKPLTATVIYWRPKPIFYRSHCWSMNTIGSNVGPKRQLTSYTRRKFSKSSCWAGNTVYICSQI